MDCSYKVAKSNIGRLAIEVEQTVKILGNSVCLVRKQPFTTNTNESETYFQHLCDELFPLNYSTRTVVNTTRDE